MTFGTLALIAAVGLAGPLLAAVPKRIAPPVVIGEIAAGVAVGRTGTGTIDARQPTLAFLASIGFVLLMLIVGTNIPMRDRSLVSAIRRALLPTAITIAAAAVLAPAIAAISGLHRPAVIAVLLASSSAAIILPIVQSDERHVGLVTIAWVSIMDVLTVLAVPVVLQTGGVGRALLGSLLVIAGAAAVGIVAPRLARLPAIDTVRDASVRGHWALDLRLSLLFVFTLAWIAQYFDTSVLIAGFSAGVMIAAIGEPRRVAQQLIGLGEGFFVPLFFVVLGAQIDLRALARSGDDLRLLALLVAGGVAVDLIAVVIARMPLSHGLLASAELGVPSAVASIGLTTHALTGGQAAAIVGAAVISLAVAAAGAIWAGITPATQPHP
jgi:Kef-type K+ transport system membrane component KefB